SSTSRISTSSSGVIWFALSGSGEREIECSSSVQFSFSPNAASMAQHDTLNERQANACALELFNGMEALKDTKQFTAVLHVESDAIVANVVHVLIALVAETNLDGRIVFWAGKFEGVGDEIIEYLAYHRAVRKRRWKVMELQQKLPFFICRLNLVEDSLRQRLHINIGLFQRLTAQA